MSSARTDLSVALALAAACALPGGTAAASDSDRPVLFRNPDKDTAQDIDRYARRFGNPSPSDREIARDVLADIGYWAVPRLLEEAASKKAQFRTNALLVLGRLGDPRQVGPTREVVRTDSSDWPPVVAALNLGRRLDGDDRTLAVFREALASRENELRQSAVLLALAKIGRVREEEAWTLIEQALDRPAANPSVHWAGYLALGFFPSRVARPTEDGTGWVPRDRFKAALRDPTWQNRLSAVLALAVTRLDAFHDVFVEAFRTDGDKQVRCAALMALGMDPGEETTDLVASVLGNVKSNADERRTAVYLLALRKDPRSLEALRRAATSSAASEIAAAAVIALGSIDEPAAVRLVKSKLTDRNATVRAAAAVACTRLRATEDLVEARDLLSGRRKSGEHDPSARVDMELAEAEIIAILKDRETAARGETPAPRRPVEWLEADSADLFRTLDRTHRQAVLDLVNRRVLQVFYIDALPDYRPHDATMKSENDDGPGADGTGGRVRREHQTYSDQYDIVIELTHRPYFGDADLPGRPVEAIPK